jgi:hypothetical protein
MRHRRPDFTRAARCLTRGHGPRPPQPHRAGGDIRDHGRYRKSHLRRDSTAHAATHRRLGAADSCTVRGGWEMQIVWFCVLAMPVGRRACDWTEDRWPLPAVVSGSGSTLVSVASRRIEHAARFDRRLRPVEPVASPHSPGLRSQVGTAPCHGFLGHRGRRSRWEWPHGPVLGQSHARAWKWPLIGGGFAMAGERRRP